jgi:4-hydroxy-3-methylbut-2-enyl diphosphate reductase
MAPRCDLVLVIGATNSSNSQRLREVAEREGAASHLISRAADIDWTWFEGVATLGLTAGASAPELLVQEVLSRLDERFTVSTDNVTTAVEQVVFKLPRALVAE